MLAFVRFSIIFIYFVLMNTALMIVFIFRPMHRDNVYLAAQWYITMGRIIRVKVDLRVSDKLNSDTSYMYISNHQSTYDLVTVAAAARPGAVTVGKKSLKWIPIFGQIYWLSGNILIDRNDKQSARGTLALTARKVLSRNLSIFMFPEGTRSRGRGVMPFKTGAFRLAQMTKQPLVPICCSDISQIRLNKWDNGTVIVEIMDPVYIDKDENPKNIAQEWELFYRNKFEQLTAEAKYLSAKEKFSE